MKLCRGPNSGKSLAGSVAVSGGREQGRGQRASHIPISLVHQAGRREGERDGEPNSGKSTVLLASAAAGCGGRERGQKAGQHVPISAHTATRFAGVTGMHTQ